VLFRSLPLCVVNFVVPFHLIFSGSFGKLGFLFAAKILLDVILFSFRAPKTLLAIVPIIEILYFLATPVFILLFIFKRRVEWKSDVLPLNRKKSDGVLATKGRLSKSLLEERAKDKAREA
jgi:hypothetical protein